jgi:UDP-GlcNAc:undecaprenyl-phosphate GlcNAc-1-phosphate transferase
VGDAGSTLLGFTLAAVALVLIQPDRANMPPAYVLWFVPIPIFELFTSTFCRLRDDKSPLFADSSHFHHALLTAGFSVRLIFFIYISVSLVCAALGLVAYFDGTPEWVVFFGFVALYVAWLSFIRLSPTIGRRLPLWMRRDIQNRHV